jgi:hypothetical protein
MIAPITLATGNARRFQTRTNFRAGFLSTWLPSGKILVVKALKNNIPLCESLYFCALARHNTTTVVVNLIL